jgi:predicted RNA binding protein YcfA (HicA-like mRNA interferase family)
MAKVPRDVSGERAVRAFRRIGYVLDHQTGSHMILTHTDASRKPLTIPNHRTIKVGLLAKFIKDAALSVEEFIELL